MKTKILHKTLLKIQHKILLPKLDTKHLPKQNKTQISHTKHLQKLHKILCLIEQGGVGGFVNF